METKKHVTACLLIGLLSIAHLPNVARASEQPGKQKMKVEITEGQIDVISNIIYSQVTLRNANLKTANRFV